MQINIMYPQHMSFSCFHWIVTFLIAIQPWSWTARSGYTGLVTAAASVKYPGEMYPKSLSILIGDSANITCRLSDPNSSQIWFLEGKTKRPYKQSNQSSSHQIKIIDPYTAVLMIHNAVEANSRYQCKVGENAIAETELYVGTKPQNVTDFSCISYDYEYMECSFTKPKNMILTSFNLQYTLDSFVHNCSCHDGKNHTVKCNVTDYFPMRDKYLFTLNGTNVVGENTQTFLINNHKIVIPSPVDIVQQNITSNNILLSLEKLKIAYYIEKGLTYDIQIRDNNSNWQTPQMGDLDCQNGTCNIVISNLYAFWLYWVKVRVKSNAVNNDDFWSKESIIQFQTKAERPYRAPEAPLGSFYIDSSDTELRLYWEQMPEHEHNGPGFHYIVYEINTNGDVMLTTKTEESSLTLAWKNESMQTFIIRSANEIGESINNSVIRVYRSTSSRYELNENNIDKLYYNSSYTLSWKPPPNVAELLNYTVFWCLQKIANPNECRGPISYKYLDKVATNFTTEPKDRSLNFAISANYPHYNKGMQWARCSADVSSELMKMELEVNALNESAILVKWSTGIVCPSILKGYNLTYCQALDNKCVTPEITVELLREKKEFRNYTISDLPAFTEVCLNMFMYSSTRRGRFSDWHCIKTKQMAPSPPKNITKSIVTSKSAKIQWSPPSVKNGILSYYSIYWRKYPEQTFEKNTTSVNETSYNLTGLSSYSNYEVYVTAHTIEESVPSRRINFTTLIGIPSGPRNLNSSKDGVISWDQPDMPSGRHIFYVVALTWKEDSTNTIYERVSIVRGRSCRFSNPCLNSKKAYTLRVRAVNVGEKEEVDQEIVSMSKDTILAGAPVDDGFCQLEDNEFENFFDANAVPIFHNDFGKFYFASPWIDDKRIITCSGISEALIYALALIIVFVFAAYIACWIRNTIIKMKNISVVLPEGLDHPYNPRNGSELGSTTKKEFHSDISRSNDCLVSYGHKENHNLITNFHSGSSNALSSLSSTNSSNDRQKEEQIGEHPSLETTNEELSSNSSSATNSNHTYHDHHQIKRLSSIDSNNTIPASGCEEEEEEDDVEQDNDEGHSETHSLENENVQNFTTQPYNGYVTHNSQLLASILNATDRNVPTAPHFNSTFPTMTNDGYIQPSAAKQLFQPSFSHHHQQPQPQTSINGYTCIESLGKLTTPDESRHVNIATSQGIANSPVSNATATLNTTPLNGVNIPTAATKVSSNILSSLHTSPVITDIAHESPSAEYNKDNLQQNATTVVSATNVSLQPNNNNNTIYGYVTQQQLATFGTNVALGKELNT